MLRLLQSLGLTRDQPAPSKGTVHAQIHAALGDLGEERVEYLAAFAGLLARAAYADAEITPAEEAAMAASLREAVGLEAREADLVSAIAHRATQVLGDVEDYLLTRAFNEVATFEQKEGLIEALYAVAGADHVVSSAEDDEIKQIGKALLIPHGRIMDIRLRHRDRLAVLRNLPSS
jgi:uncharacterized tellurite resistance protein B-like protein